MNQLSDIAEPVKNILEPISEQVPAALPAVGGKKTRGQRRKRRQNRSSKHRK
jgi:hypothetical protein